MRNKEIIITYVDDDHNHILSGYLSDFTYKNFKVKYEWVTFGRDANDYKELINHDAVRNSDILVIDSRLFEEQDADTKLTGEVFKAIYELNFPDSRIFVITKNPGREKYGTFSKGPNHSDEEDRDYYKKEIGEVICKAIDDIYTKRLITKELVNSQVLADEILVQKIKDTTAGISTYSDLSDDKIDEVIIEIEKLLIQLDGADDGIS